MPNDVGLTILFAYLAVEVDFAPCVTVAALSAPACLRLSNASFCSAAPLPTIKRPDVGFPRAPPVAPQPVQGTFTETEVVVLVVTLISGSAPEMQLLSV